MQPISCDSGADRTIGSDQTRSPGGIADFAGYFDRIGYSGPYEPSLVALRGVVAGHAAVIPFENIDVLLRRPIRLDLASLLDKLVHRRRGGYCFEHNTLLMAALRALGFAVEGLGARVVWLRDDDEVPPRTHMLLRVALPEGPCLADVGFGGLTLTAPLRLAAGEEQATPHEMHRLVPIGNELRLEARLGGRWTGLYRFSPEPLFPIDYEVANWFTATYPEGLFTDNLLMARPDAERRYALFNNEFTIHWLDGRQERRTLVGAAELGELLLRHFHLRLTDDELVELAAVIGRHAAAPARSVG
jgi:N-hydroxyarylamine O-acetyltransferase